MAQDPYSIFTQGLPATPVSEEASNSVPEGDGFDLFTKGLPAVPTAIDTADQPTAGEIEQSKRANAFRARSVEDLKDDKSFDPLVEYFNQLDGEAKQKVLDVFKAREQAPVNWWDVTKGVVAAPVHAINAFGTGIGTVAAQGVNIVEGLTSNHPDRAASAAGELAAGAETNITGLLNTIETAKDFSKQKNGEGPKTDDEWRALLAKKADFNEAVKEAARGEGTISRKIGEDDTNPQTWKSIVEQQGGSIDPQTASDAAPALDPTLFIPILAGARGAKLAATAAEAGLRFEATETGIQLVKGAGKTAKVIFDAPEGSKLFKIFDGATKVTEPALKGADVLGGFTKGVINRTTDAVGAAAEKTGALATKAGEATTLTKGGLVGGALEVLGRGAAATSGFDVPGAGIAAGVAIPKALKTAGSVLNNIGGKLRGDIPAGPLYRQIANTSKGSLVKGAAAGVGLTGDPAALAFSTIGFAGAPNDEERGAALGGQATFGAAGHGFAEGVHAAKPYFDIAGQVLKPGETSTPVNSPGYGSVPALDELNTAAMSKLSPEAQNSINQFREAVRGRDTQMYVVSPEDFGRAYTSFKAQEATARGETLSNEQLAALRDSASKQANAAGVVYENFDLGDGKSRKVVFLNSDGGALQHEGGHVLTSLLEPTAYKQIAESIRKRYTPDELAEFQSSYEDKLGHTISEPQLIDEIMAENVSAVLNSVPVEKLGTPKSVARSIYQHLGGLLENLGGKPAGERTTALGARPDLGVNRLAENLLRSQETAARPVIEKTTKVDLSKVDLGPRTANAGGSTANAGGSTGEPLIRTKENPNIRVSREDQNRFRRAEVDSDNKKASAAVDSNPNYGPTQKAAFVKLASVLHQGGDRPRPVEIDYSSANSEEFNSGRTVRRDEQSTAERAEAGGAVPENVRQLAQKVFIPTRFEVLKDGEVQLIAQSLDKMLGNAYRLTKDANKNGVGHLIPYDHVDGVLTEQGHNELVRDVQTYTKNQSYGYAGTGDTVIRPKGYLGEIPDQVKTFKPTSLSKEKSDFVNTVMGFAPPGTGKKGNTKSGVHANVIARSLAEANNKEVLPSVTTRDPKNKFLEREKVEVGEFNPLRDKLARAGVDIRDMIEASERIKLSRINGEVKVRNDLDFSRPSTDLMRASFMPDPRKAVRRGDTEIRDIADEYTKSSGIPYRPYDGYAKIDPELGKSLADWHDAAKSSPDDPQVKAAYDALISETKRQWDTIKQAGYTIEPWTGQGEPYHSSADMVEDVRKNKHLWFFKTENGFGNGGTSPHNPLLKPAGEGMVVNDYFRGVHDFFGHAKEGYEFGPRGEYNAFLAHSSMFSEAALPALAAETLSQNAWVNFGKHLRDGEGNIPGKGNDGYIPLQNRPFADQKVVAVPKDLLDRALAPKTEGETTTPVKSNVDDLTRYNEIQIEMSNLIKEKKGGSPEFTELWRENEAIKNRNEEVPGMPPGTKPQDMAPNAQFSPRTDERGEVSFHGVKLKDFLGKEKLSEYNQAKDAIMAQEGALFGEPRPVQEPHYDGTTLPGMRSTLTKKGRMVQELDAQFGLDHWRAGTSPERAPDAPTADFMPKEVIQHSGEKLPDSIKEKSLNVVHYAGAKAGKLKTVDPKFMNPKPDVFSKMYRGEQKSFFFVEGSGPLKEENVSRSGKQYTAKISGERLYNMDKDPQDLWFNPNPAKSDQTLKDQGYVGFAVTDDKNRRFVALYEPTKVTAKPDASYMPKTYTAEQAAELKRDVSGWLFPDGEVKFAGSISSHDQLAEAHGLQGIETARAAGGLRMWMNGEERLLTVAVDSLTELPASQEKQVLRLAQDNGLDVRLDTGRTISVAGDSTAKFMPATDTTATPKSDDTPELPPLIRPYSAKDDGGYVIKPVAPKPPKERTGIFSTPTANFKPAAGEDILKSRPYRDIAQHLTPDEAFKMRRDTAADVVAKFKELPPDIDFETAAKAGMIKQGWYKRAADSLKLVFGPDTESFVSLLAATSPRQSVIENLNMALNIWGDWQEAGRPAGHDAIKAIVEQHAEMQARIPNAIRAIQGHDPTVKLDTNLDGKAQLSGNKVESFRRNLLSDMGAVTNDTWMALFSNFDQSKFGTKSGYLAMNAKVRRVADKLGMQPAEVQETIWSFFKTLTEGTTVARPAKETLASLHESDILGTPEFHEQLLNDPAIKSQLERLGFTGFDRLANQAGAGRPAPRGGVVELLTKTDGENHRRSLERIAKRAQEVSDSQRAGAKVEDAEGDPY